MAGDVVAKRIMADAASAFLRTAAVVSAGHDVRTVVLAGSVLTTPGPVADAVRAGLPDHVTSTGPAGPRIVARPRPSHSRIKRYLKDGRALRIETVISSPRHLGVLSRLEHLNELQDEDRACNRRLVDAEHVGQGCVLARPACVRVAALGDHRRQEGPGPAVRRSG